MQRPVTISSGSGGRGFADEDVPVPVPVPEVELELETSGSGKVTSSSSSESRKSFLERLFLRFPRPANGLLREREWPRWWREVECEDIPLISGGISDQIGLSHGEGLTIHVDGGYSGKSRRW